MDNETCPCCGDGNPVTDGVFMDWKADKPIFAPECQKAEDSMNPFTATAVAVAQGKTNSQFAIPDGKCTGDLFFITDAANEILIAFMWTGSEWIHEHQAMDIQDSPQTGKPPSGLKHIKMDSSADEIAITNQFRPQWTAGMIRSYLAQGGTMQTRYGQPEVKTDQKLTFGDINTPAYSASTEAEDSNAALPTSPQPHQAGR